jgi:VanZ family protein
VPEVRQTRRKVAVFLLFAVATVLLGVFYGRYVPVGSELLANSDFGLGFDHWILKGPPDSIVLEDDRTARLRSSDPGGHVSLTQPIDDPCRFGLVRLSGEMRTEDVVAGERSWHKARLILSSFDRTGQWVPAPHHVYSLVGTHSWKRYAEVFRVVPEADQVRVSAQLEQATGTLWVRNLSLREVAVRPDYPYVQRAACGLWGLFLVWLLAPSVVGSGRIVWRGMVLLSTLLVLGGTLLPGGYRREIEKDLTHSYQSIEAPDPSRTEAPVQRRERTLELWENVQKVTKSGHFVLFGLFGLSLASALPLTLRRLLLLDIAMLAGATELLQFFVEGRTPLIGDWLLDLAGAVAGLTLGNMWGRSCLIFLWSVFMR